MKDNSIYRWVKASDRLPEGVAILRTPDRDGLRKVFELYTDAIDLKTFFSPFKLYEIEWLCKVEADNQDEAKKLIELQEKYINWLGENVKGAEQIAFIHGFNYDVTMLDEGVKMRNEIQKLLKQFKTENNLL